MEIIGKVLRSTVEDGRAKAEIETKEGTERIAFRAPKAPPVGTTIKATDFEQDKNGILRPAKGAKIKIVKAATPASPAPIEKKTPAKPKTLARFKTITAAVDHLLPQVNPSAAALLAHGLTEEQVSILQGYTPTRFLQVRKIRGGALVTYVDINYVIAALNYAFGHAWTEEYDAPLIQGDQVATRCRLTARFPDGTTATRTATGGHEVARYTFGEKAGQVIDLGDTIKIAEADALKKAASKFGIAWDVYAGVTVHPQATQGAKVIYQVVEVRPVAERHAEEAPDSAHQPPAAVAPPTQPTVTPPAAVAPLAVTLADTATHRTGGGATPTQVAFALKAFGGDAEALLHDARELGILAARPEEVPFPTLRRITRERLEAAKVARAGAASQATAAQADAEHRAA